MPSPVPVFETSSVTICVPPGLTVADSGRGLASRSPAASAKSRRTTASGVIVGALGQRSVELRRGLEVLRTAARGEDRVEAVALLRRGGGRRRAAVREGRDRGAAQSEARVRVADVADDQAARQDWSRRTGRSRRRRPPTRGRRTRCSGSGPGRWRARPRTTCPRSWCSGPERPPGAFQTLVHVAPPSIETSTSAMSPKPLVEEVAGAADRRVGAARQIHAGVTRYESSKKARRIAVVDRVRAGAAGPIPFGEPAGIRARRRSSSLAPDFVCTVQPGGMTPPSKLSERTGGPYVPAPYSPARRRARRRRGSSRRRAGRPRSRPFRRRRRSPAGRRSRPPCTSSRPQRSAAYSPVTGSEYATTGSVEADVNSMRA